MTDPLAVPHDVSARAEDQFLLAVARAIARGSVDAVPTPPPGDRWIERAVPHGILIPVIGALRAAGLGVPLALATQRATAALRAVTSKQDLATIATALDAAGVEWVVMKGPVLSEVVYARRGTRESTDLDLLVAPGQLRLAVSALGASEAQLLGVDWTQRTWAKGAEVPMLMPSGTIVDLHWHLLNRPAMRRAYGLAMNPLLGRRVVRELGRLEVPTLDDLDLVLHVLLHACLDGCGRLRAFLDAQQCVSWLDSMGCSPRDLADRAAACGLAAPSWLVLSMTADLLDPTVARWRDAITGPTLWARGVHRLSRRPDGTSLTNGLTRRLVRYTAPSSAGSVLGVGGYATSRMIRLVRPDRTEVSGVAPVSPNPAFERFLTQVASRAGLRS